MDAVDGRWGIPFLKVGRCVRYRPEDLYKWALQQQQEQKANPANQSHDNHASAAVE